MLRPELEEKILDYIKDLYKATYVGSIKVNQEDDIYTLYLGLPSYMMETTISSQASDDDAFLDFIYEEIRTRNYMRLDIYKVTRTNDSKEE